MNDLSHFTLCKNTNKRRTRKLTVSGVETSVMGFLNPIEQNYKLNLFFYLKEHIFGQAWGRSKKIDKISQNRPKNVFFCLKSRNGKTVIP